MGEEPAKSRGWLKTILGTATGLLSGAVVMYLTPLVDKVVKPAKPVANFAVDHEGLSVTFHNRSQGGSAGWWDFGDGSPLEPVSPQQEIVTHTYPGPGDFTAKLTLHNLLGEESERPVTFHLDTPHTDPPAILSLDVTPIAPEAFAPATFKVASKTKNTQLCIWDVGDDRPFEISADSPENQERLVTFPKPGGYVIKLAAVSGTQAVEKSEVVYVNEPPAGAVAVVLTVSEDATRVENVTTSYTFHEQFPPSVSDETHSFSHQVPARPGYEIMDVHVRSANGPGLAGRNEMIVDPGTVGGRGAQNLRLRRAADGRSVRLTGELVKEAGMGKRGVPLPAVAVPVVLVQERRSRVGRPGTAVTATLTPPASTLLALPPMPGDWTDARRHVHLELRDGDHTVWQGSQLPANVPVTLHKQRYTLSARALGGQVKIDLLEVRSGFAPAAN
jgi:PKD repeat protein